MKSHLRDIRISPKKANIIAGMVQGKSAEESLVLLRFLPKKAAKVLFKVITSAVSNAENNDNQKVADLMIKQIIVNRGPVWKRHLPSTRGRALPIRKPTSHITVELAAK
jgi:large subunit ribosomal protein L22